MVDSLTLKSQPTRAWMKLIWYIIFSMRHITAFLCLGTLESTSALCLETISNSGITNKNLKTNMALKGPWKGHVSTMLELKQEGTTLPCSASSGNVCTKQLDIFTALCMSLSTMKVQCMLWGLQINFSRQANLQIRNLCIMKMDSVPKRSGLKQHTFSSFCELEIQVHLSWASHQRSLTGCKHSAGPASLTRPSRFNLGRIDLQVHSHGGRRYFIFSKDIELLSCRLLEGGCPSALTQGL